MAPDSKIIVIVRDPVERLYSDYLYFNDGHEIRTPQSFDIATKKELKRMSECLETHNLRRCCYATENDLEVRLYLGMYICFVRDWYELFRDNLLVVTLEEYSNQPIPVLRRIFRFIQVPAPDRDLFVDYVFSTKPVQNARNKKNSLQGDMLSATRKLLHDFYSPYNAQLARLLNVTLPW